MDAAVPWVVLGVVLLVLAGLTAGLLAVPAVRGRPAGASATRAAVPGPPLPAFPDDDLPGFRTAPPGTPGAVRPRRVPARVWMVPVTGADGDRPAGRALLAMAAAALALVAVLALLAGAEAGTGSGTSRDAVRPAGGTSAGTSGPAPPPVPALAPEPGAPHPGQSGAGALAPLSVPLDAGGWAARVAFAPLVLERRAVGVTVAAPAVSVTRRSDGTALAHVRWATWNCLAAEAPADPAAAGCAAGPVEYADLPSPALATTVEDGRLRLTGRFPTYTRPAGSPPVYTGRVYELAVTVQPERAAEEDGGEVPATGTLFLGLDRTESLTDPGLSVVRRGG